MTIAVKQKGEMMDDLISRKEVIKAIEDEWDGCLGEYNSACIIRDTCEAIDRVASTQPERKTGRWIRSGNKLVPYYCSSCTGRFDYEWKFCPNCGAKMLKEDEGK